MFIESGTVLNDEDVTIKVHFLNAPLS
jgi:hypothetical protein